MVIVQLACNCLGQVCSQFSAIPAKLQTKHKHIIPLHLIEGVTGQGGGGRGESGTTGTWGFVGGSGVPLDGD